MGPSKKDYIFIGLIVVALFGGWILGMRPDGVPKTPREYLVELYIKPNIDNIKLYFVSELTENCTVGGFRIDEIPRDIIVCAKGVTMEEIKMFRGEDGIRPRFIGKFFDYDPQGRAFGKGDTEEERRFMEKIVGRVISYVEAPSLQN